MPAPPSQPTRPQGAATIVPVSNVANTIGFYVDILGFEKREQSADGKYGLVALGDVAVMLIGTDDPEVLKATANNISIYIWVDGVDEYYAELKPRLEALPQGRVRAPFEQPYGMREFHLKDPDGCLLFFGQELTT